MNRCWSGILACFLYSVQAAVAASPAQVSVLPAVVTLAPGESTTVAVHLEGGTLLHGSSVVLAFDTNRVLVTAVANGDVYPEGAGLMFRAPAAAARADSVIVDQAMLGTVAAGSTGTMFTVTFTARTAGSSAVHVRSVRMQDTGNQPMAAEGTDGQIVIAAVAVNMKAFLQGPYNGGVMLTALRNAGAIPLAQPYGGAPWSYGGTESVGAIPAGVVDWVLVEVRSGTAAGTKVGERAAFLRSDGMVVDTDGVSPVGIGGVAAGAYYLVLRHRNHLAVMTAGAVPLGAVSALCDLSSGTGAYYQGAGKALGGGVYGLYAGDADADGQITSTDFNVFNPKFTSAANGYQRSDWNCDALVTSVDFNIFNANFTSAQRSRVP